MKNKKAIIISLGISLLIILSSFGIKEYKIKSTINKMNTAWEDKNFDKVDEIYSNTSLSFNDDKIHDRYFEIKDEYIASEKEKAEDAIHNMKNIWRSGGNAEQAEAEYKRLISQEGISEYEKQAYEEGWKDLQLLIQVCEKDYSKKDNSSKPKKKDIEIESKKVKAKGDYIYLTFSVTNNTNESISYMKFDIRLKDRDGNVVNTDWTNWSGNLRSGDSCIVDTMIPRYGDEDNLSISLSEKH